MVWRKPLFAIAVMIAATSVQAKTYCCTDDHGRRVCGDILPEQCQKRSYSELNAQGVLRKQYEAPLSPEQRAQRDAETARKKAEEKQAAEDMRRDRVLVASYSTIADLDAKRARVLIGANANLKAAKERLEAAEAQRQKLTERAAAIRDRPVPPILKAKIGDNEAELVASQAELAAKKKELIDIQASFDEDRRRYLRLTGASPTAPAAPSAPVAPTAPIAPKAPVPPTPPAR
jgi:hypothetical protein